VALTVWDAVKVSARAQPSQGCVISADVATASPFLR